MYRAQIKCSDETKISIAMICNYTAESKIIYLHIREFMEIRSLMDWDRNRNLSSEIPCNAEEYYAKKISIVFFMNLINLGIVMISASFENASRS